MKVIGWFASWICYGIGSFISWAFLRFDSISMMFYPIYNKLMTWSMIISDRHDLKIWTTRQDRIKNAVQALEEALEEDDELTEEVAELVGKIYAKHQEQFAIAKTVAKEIIKKSLPDYNKSNIVDTHIGVPKSQFCLDVPREPNYSESPCIEIELSESNPCTLQEPGLVFEIGKAYRHTGGGEMMIVGRANTTLWGDYLIAEEAGGTLKPVGEHSDYSVNWHEISLEEWDKNFS